MRNFVFIFPPLLSAKLSTATSQQNSQLLSAQLSIGSLSAELSIELQPLNLAMRSCFSKKQIKIFSTLPKAFAQAAGRANRPNSHFGADPQILKFPIFRLPIFSHLQTR